MVIDDKFQGSSLLSLKHTLSIQPLKKLRIAAENVLNFGPLGLLNEVMRGQRLPGPLAPGSMCVFPCTSFNDITCAFLCQPLG